MFKNYSDCAKCVHASVCQYRSELKEIYDKIGAKWDNLAAPTDIFKLELRCEEFQDSAIIKKNPFY